jgi:hypothetical protein
VRICRIDVGLGRCSPGEPLGEEVVRLVDLGGNSGPSMTHADSTRSRHGASRDPDFAVAGIDLTPVR